MAVVQAALAKAIAYLSKLHGFAVPSINVSTQQLLCLILEVIIDYGSAFVTYGNEIESKGVQFPGRDAPDKIGGGSLLAVAPDTSKICGFVPQEHQE